MGKDAANILAALGGTMILFVGAFFFLREYEPEGVPESPELTEASATEPEPTRAVPKEIFVSLPKFDQWQDTPMQVHLLENISPGTLEQIRHGQDLVHKVLFQNDSLQEDLKLIEAAVDWVSRDITPSSEILALSNFLKNGLVEFETIDLSDVHLPKRPEPSKGVAPPVIQDFERLMRGFYIQDFEVVIRSFNIRAESWGSKLGSNGSGTSVTPSDMASIGYIREVGSFFSNISRLHDHYVYTQAAFAGTDGAREKWAEFKVNTVPQLNMVIDGATLESAEVDSGGRVQFSSRNLRNIYFVGELDIRGNTVFILLGEHADPKMKVLWTHKKQA